MAITVTSTTDSSEIVQAENSEAKSSKESADDKKSASAKEESLAQDETTEESETSKEDLDEGRDTDDQDDTDDEQDENDESAEKAKPKKKGGFQKRIERFQKKLSAKDQEIEHWKREALKTKEQQNDNSKAPDTSKTPIDGKPKADDFETHEEFIEALTDWKLEQRQQALEEKQKNEQAKSAYQKAMDEYNSRVAEFKKQTSDFDEVLADFIEEHGNVRFSPAFEESVITSDLGPAIVYELVKDKKEFDRINSLGPIAMAREIGKLEARLTKSSEPIKEKKFQTKAPPPLKPVGNKGAGSIKKSIYDTSLSQREYERLREEQLAQSGR